MNFLSGLERSKSYCDEDTSIVLPLLECPTLPDLNSISCDTLAGLIIEFKSQFKIIDCRFDYEFEGGHIRGAVNVSSPELLCEALQLLTPGTPLIFHCEFSQFRGPSMYRWLRNYDRNANIENYPRLDYPHIYLLKGGYEEFFRFYKDLCDPAEYVPADTCKRMMKQNLKVFNMRLKTRSRTMFA